MQVLLHSLGTAAEIFIENVVKLEFFFQDEPGYNLLRTSSCLLNQRAGKMDIKSPSRTGGVRCELQTHACRD